MVGLVLVTLNVVVMKVILEIMESQDMVVVLSGVVQPMTQLAEVVEVVKLVVIMVVTVVMDK